MSGYRRDWYRRWGLGSNYRPGASETVVGLDVTPSMLSLWRSRAINGPVKTLNDGGSAYGVNNPGDWDRVATANTAFDGSTAAVMDPVAIFGVDGNGALNLGGQYGIGNTTWNNMQSAKDAAFYGLIKQDSAAIQNFMSYAVRQAGVSGADFSNRTIYPTGFMYDYNPGFQIVEAVVNLVYGYSYSLAAEALGIVSLNSSDKLTFATWIDNIITYMWKSETYDHLTNQLYGGSSSNRASFTLSGVGLNRDATAKPYDSYSTTLPTVSLFYNNRRSASLRLAGLWAELTNNTTTRAEAQQTIKEYLRFWVFADPDADGGPWWVGEFERNYDTGQTNTGETPSTVAANGLLYGMSALEGMLEIAHAQALRGDTTLLNYSTRSGYLESVCPSGQPDKTLLELTQQLLLYHQNTYATRKATPSATAYFILPRSQDSRELGVAKANQYWKSASIDSILRRITQYYDHFSTSPSGNAEWSWGHGQGGRLFQWTGAEALTASPF